MSEALENGGERRPDVLAEVGKKGDFPAAAQVAQRLREAIGRENCTALDVARAILQDHGLASKVLRIVNSAFYRKRGQPVSTITRAIIVLGFETIRDLATGVMLMDEFLRRGGSNRVVRDTVQRSLHTALLSQRLSTKVGYPVPEEAYLLGLFSNLGLLWVATQYPVDFEEVLRVEREKGIEVEIAVAEVFGVGTPELSAAIMDQWHLPASYASYFREIAPSEGPTAVGPAGRLAALVHLAADYTRAADSSPEAVQMVMRRAEGLLGIDAKQFVAATGQAGEAFQAQCSQLGLGTPRLPPHAPVPRERSAPRRPASPPPAPPAEAHRDAPPAPDERTASVSAAAADEGNTATDEGNTAAVPAQDAGATLEILAEITGAVVEEDDINHVLFMVLEGIARVGSYDAVFLALLNVRKDRIIGRLGHGEGVEAYLDALSVPLEPDAGVLAQTVLGRRPHVVPDGNPGMFVPAGAPAPRIPARSFIAYPLRVRGKVVGVIVAARAAGPRVGSADLTVVQLFCNQASVALAQRAS